MIQAPRRPRLGLAAVLLSGAALAAPLLSGAALAAPRPPSLPTTPPVDPEGSLARAELEQELILAERTAVLLGALHDHRAER